MKNKTKNRFTYICIKKNNEIMVFSFCTTCMNRLEHIKSTLPTNLSLIKEFNIKYQDKHIFELSLCNYDSKDNLTEYIETEFKTDIENGILVYNIVYNKQFFNPSHAKNIAHKKSNGDILINIDADNYLTDLFIYKLISLFENNLDILTIGYDDKINSGAYGRICISRDNFYKLGGYFENFIGYGLQDYDLVERGKKYLNLKEYIFEKEYIKFIYHDNLSRIINYDRDLYSKNEIDFNKIYNVMDLDLLHNVNLHNSHMNNNIMNINEYNNIIFGEI